MLRQEGDSGGGRRVTSGGGRRVTSVEAGG